MVVSLEVATHPALGLITILILIITAVIITLRFRFSLLVKPAEESMELGHQDFTTLELTQA